MKYDYDFFLFSQIWIDMSGCAFLPSDLMFAQIIASYEDFLKSHSNDDTKILSECMEHYFINLNANEN
jgi:hypothetical protein